MRVALHSVLKPGHEADYDRDHSRIPDDLAVSFARVGIHDWSIWREGAHLFHLVDCDDFDRAMAALADDPANVRWQRHIGRHVDRFEPTGDPDAIAQVWSLEAQRASDESPS